MLKRMPAEALFIASAIAQYVGASIAVGIFEFVEPQTVAWFRVVGAVAALLIFSPRFWEGWTFKTLISAGFFGTVTAGMNTCFYLAIAEIDLGKSVAIEFIGPIAVAAFSTRSIKNAFALIIVASGVVILGGAEISDNHVAMAYLLAASALWAAYIVIGSKVANNRNDLAGLGVGLALGALVTSPIGLSDSLVVFSSLKLLLLACATGVFSNAIGYGIDQYVLRRVSVRRFSLLLATLPVTAVFIGWVTLGQRPTLADSVGIIAVLIGVALQDRDEADEPNEEPEAEQPDPEATLGAIG